MKKDLLMTVLVLFYSVSVAYADYFDGNMLIKLMDSTRDVDITMSRGYVAGIQDSFNGGEFLVPPKVKMSQASAVVHKYLKAHPEKWHEAAWVLVVEALKDAYPLKE